MTVNQNGKPFLNKDGTYKELNKNDIEDRVNELLRNWNQFLISQDEALVQEKDYFIHTRNLYEVIKRLDKRKTYYYVFHGIEEICEYKEIAILCYWINTLKPFMVVDENSKIYSCPNEMFSLYLILATLATIFDEKNPDAEFVLPDDKIIQDYVYNFKYCDLSREATIFFVETLARSYGIGMETNIRKDIYKK